MKKVLDIFFDSIPVLVMIGLITVVKNDYLLTLSYILIIVVCLFIKKTNHDFKIMILGFFTMMVFEYIFVSTGVEIFVRNSLFNIMPLWLPFLWAYGFVIIARAVQIIKT